MAATYRVGVDIGGTFTDIVLLGSDGTIHTKKISSSVDNYATAVVQGLDELFAETGLAGGAIEEIRHGTTVATNALLERRGASVALVATEGFADEIEIARQVRPSLYDPFADRVEPLVPRALRFGVVERLDAAGNELVPFAGSVPSLPDEIDAIAVCLLHSDLNPAHERAVAEALQAAHDKPVICSHDVSPEFREYERMVTTFLPTQSSDGSWPGYDRSSPGPVYQTAIAVIALSVPMNYLPIYQR